MAVVRERWAADWWASVAHRSKGSGYTGPAQEEIEMIFCFLYLFSNNIEMIL
jgi:hypothetical protein